MILAIDVGNTNIVLGCVDHGRADWIERISTVKTKTEAEYAIDIKMMLDIHHVDHHKIEGAIISCVVPQIQNPIRMAAKKIIKKKVLVIGPGIKTGLNIKIDDPASLGADIVADSVAAMQYQKFPIIVIDMGTATTVTVINKKKEYIGGLIIPGVMVSLNALAANASLLFGISIDTPKQLICTTATESMLSGILYSNASAIDGILERMEEELGEPCTVVATGGLAKRIIPLCRHEIIIDDSLLLKGLQIIYDKNRK